MTKIAPSVLGVDFSKSSEWLKELEESNIDRIHWDIMDNEYVPNTGVDKNEIAELRPKTKLFFESHLMVSTPRDYLEDFCEMGNELFNFHVETQNKINSFEIISEIEDLGMKTGMTINNETNPESLVPFLEKLDLVLVMSVDAGFGGQSFNEKALEKISFLRKKIDEESLSCEIEVDGGVNAETGKKCVEAGADILVAGSYIFKNENGIKHAIESLINIK